MKKLLLLALVAIFGVSAQAQDTPDMIKDQPAGTVTTYKQVRTVSRSYLSFQLKNWLKTVSQQAI